MLNQLKTLQAEFTQRVEDLHGNVIDRSHGTLYLVRPGKFRWENHGSETQIIVTNGKTLWLYDPDLQQVTVRPFEQTGMDTPCVVAEQQ